MTHDPGTLYRVYLNQKYDMAAVYGFRRVTEDGRKYQTRYLTDAARVSYEVEMWLIGITDISFEEIDETSDSVC